MTFWDLWKKNEKLVNVGLYVYGEYVLNICLGMTITSIKKMVNVQKTWFIVSIQVQ